jgi:hypothetical protein
MAHVKTTLRQRIPGRTRIRTCRPRKATGINTNILMIGLQMSLATIGRKTIPVKCRHWAAVQTWLLSTVCARAWRCIILIWSAD